MKGFIPLHRKLFREGHWLAPSKRHPAGRREAWLDLCQMAQHDTYEHLGVTLERGQLLTSIRNLAKRWCWSRGSVERYTLRLETETMIETVAETRSGTVYRIVNYDTYAILWDTERDGERDGERDTSGTPTGTRTKTNTTTNPTLAPESPPDSDLGGDPILWAKVRGLYGWNGSEGTDPVLVRAFRDEADRDRCLAIAVQRYADEADEYHGSRFRAFLTRVIAEQQTRSSGKPSHAGRKFSGGARYVS